MPSLHHFQIIVDIAFFVVIGLLLWQLNRRMARVPGGDGTTVGELQKWMAESQNSADLFLRKVQESEETLNHLAREIESREKRVVIIIEKADKLIQEMTALQARSEPDGPDRERYGQIMQMVHEGLSGEEIAKRVKVSRGEIDLVIELEQAREGRR
jgi:hypothetical protein